MTALSALLPTTLKPLWASLDPLPACMLFGWQNMAFLNSLYDNVCMAWTWYIGTDFLYYLLSPIPLLLLRRDRHAGFVLLAGLATISGLLNARVMQRQGFPPTPMFWRQPGIFSPDFIRDHVAHYIKPWYRVGPYAVGMALGAVLADHSTASPKVSNSQTGLTGVAYLMTFCEWGKGVSGWVHWGF